MTSLIAAAVILALSLGVVFKLSQDERLGNQVKSYLVSFGAVGAATLMLTSYIAFSTWEPMAFIVIGTSAIATFFLWLTPLKMRRS